ncbi:MAG TPA: alpha/beta fold hydrolase [Candidatus Limnocylindria bacterium]|nr:alpha/beta fold hydrolase [Candidatus Limnocylindria bacterium]
MTLRISSDGHALHADVYGELRGAERAAILVHGQNWDASGWRPYAPRFAERGVPAVALDLRGYGASEGVTEVEYVEGRPWTPAVDVRAAKQALRDLGVREIVLVGSSMGGHAVMASSFERDVESVISVSAPVLPVPDALAKRITGRKLFLCASGDPCLQEVLRTFAVVERPKELRVFEGAEHSRGMFGSSYGPAVILAMVEFACRRG